MRRPLCLISMAFVAAVYIMLHIQPMQEHTLDHKLEGQIVTRQGVVTAKEYKNGSLLVYLQGKDEEGFLCYMSEPTEPRLGSTVLVQGEAGNFRQARNPGGFDQKEYYRLQRVYYQLRNVRLLKQSEEYSFYQESLYRLRRYLEKVLEQCMEDKDASVMKAMLLGNKTQMDAGTKKLYQQSGIAHVLAISGLHISLLGMGVYELLKRLRLPSWVSAALSVLLMLMYGQMVGMSSSAYRAVFMFGMKMGAKLLHRTYDMLTALALAAVGVLLEQPLYLYQAGFLLSFGAIIGIGCMMDVIKEDMTQLSRKLRYKKGGDKLQEGLCGGLSVFCIHFPIMLGFYYEFPIYSFVLNLLIIPAMGLVMVLGLVCLGCGSIAIGLLQGIAYLAAGGCHMLLAVFEKLCELSLRLPQAVWIVGRPSVWRIVVFYLVMVLLYAVHRYCRSHEGCCMPYWLKMLWILAAVIMLTQHAYGRLEIAVLDVGQGDGIWIESDRGAHYLIDGGSTSESKLGQYTLVPFLKYKGTDTLDAVFLTHLDADHISGVKELLENSQGIKIRQVVIAQAALRDEAYEELVQLCRQQGIPLGYVQSGDYMQSGNMSLEILHPSAQYHAADRNSYSLVMKLEYGGFHALFTGDVGEDGEQAVLQALPSGWKCQLYKAAHHGSRYSNSQALLEEIEPHMAVISCGEGNSYGHPHQEVLERLQKAGAAIYRTDESGAIMLTISDDRVRVGKYVD